MARAHRRGASVAEGAATYSPAELSIAAAQLSAFACKRGVDLTEATQAGDFVSGIRALRDRLGRAYRDQAAEQPLTEASDATAESYAVFMIQAVETLCRGLTVPDTATCTRPAFKVGIEALSAMLHGAYIQQPEQEHPVTADADAAMIECADMLRFELAASELAV
jgi:hypothetical protein